MIESPRPYRPWLVAALLFAAACVALTKLPVCGQLRCALDPARVNDDARAQLPPFFVWEGDEQFRDDYVANYYRETLLPAGSRALYFVAAKTIGCVAMSRLLPYVLWLVAVALVAATAGLVSGRTGAVVAVVLALCSDLLLDRMIGGLPRAFGFPAVAGLLFGMSAGRFGLVGALTVLGALLYPIVAVLGLGLLAGAAAMPEAWRRPWRRRDLALLLVAVSLCVTVAVAAQVGAGERWGGRVGRAAWAQYPEAGPGGRWNAPDLPGYRGAVGGSLALSSRVLGGPVAGWGWRLALPVSVLMELLLGACVIGCFRAWCRGAVPWPGPAASRLAVALPVVAAAFWTAEALEPLVFIPERYLTYTVPLLTCVLTPLLLREAGRLTNLPRPSPAVVAAAALVAALGLRPSLAPCTGYTVQVMDGRPYAFLASLPPGALIAGWPGGVVEQVTYFSHRRVLLSFETHQAFHAGYLQELRRRLALLIEALLGHRSDALVALRERYAVTHLLVEPVSAAAPPRCFAPFGAAVDAAWRRGRGDEVAFRAMIAPAVIFETPDVAVVDLRRLPIPEGCAPVHPVESDHASGGTSLLRKRSAAAATGGDIAGPSQRGRHAASWVLPNEPGSGAGAESRLGAESALPEPIPQASGNRQL